MILQSGPISVSVMFQLSDFLIFSIFIFWGGGDGKKCFDCKHSTLKLKTWSQLMCNIIMNKHVEGDSIKFLISSLKSFKSVDDSKE